MVDELRTRFEIEAAADEFGGRRVYRVWLVRPGEPEPVLLGEYDSLAAAKASRSALWREGHRPGVEAWAYHEEELVEEHEAPDEEYPRG